MTENQTFNAMPIYQADRRNDVAGAMQLLDRHYPGAQLLRKPTYMIYQDHGEGRNKYIVLLEHDGGRGASLFNAVTGRIGHTKIWRTPSQSLYDYKRKKMERTKEPYTVFMAETFEAQYGGVGAIMGIAKDTPLDDFTDDELTTSSAIHGDFDKASIDYSGNQNIQVRAESFNADTAVDKTPYYEITVGDMDRLGNGIEWVLETDLDSTYPLSRDYGEGGDEPLISPEEAIKDYRSQISLFGHSYEPDWNEDTEEWHGNENTYMWRGAIYFPEGQLGEGGEFPIRAFGFTTKSESEAEKMIMNHIQNTLDVYARERGEDGEFHYYGAESFNARDFESTKWRHKETGEIATVISLSDMKNWERVIPKNAESFATEGKSFFCDACSETLPLKLRNRSLKVAQEFGMGMGDICLPCVKRIKSYEEEDKKLNPPRMDWPDYYGAEQKLKRSSCCCGATKSHPCACMIKGVMKCSATCPCSLDAKSLREEYERHWGEIDDDQAKGLIRCAGCDEPASHYDEMNYCEACQERKKEGLIDDEGNWTDDPSHPLYELKPKYAETHEYEWDEVCQECGDVPCKCFDDFSAEDDSICPSCKERVGSYSDFCMDCDDCLDCCGCGYCDNCESKITGDKIKDGACPNCDKAFDSELYLSADGMDFAQATKTGYGIGAGLTLWGATMGLGAILLGGAIAMFFDNKE